MSKFPLAHLEVEIIQLLADEGDCADMLSTNKILRTKFKFRLVAVDQIFKTSLAFHTNEHDNPRPPSNMGGSHLQCTDISLLVF